MMRLLLVAFFLEVGLVLILAPWSAWWDRNYFAQSLPHVHAFITNNFVRGAVSGLGVVNVAAGIAELLALLLSRTAQQPPMPAAQRPAIASPRAAVDAPREQE